MKYVLAAAAVAALAGGAQAGSWAEVGDAGDLPGTAQVTTGVGTLNSITGLSDASIEDKDMFAIYVTGGTLYASVASAHVSDGLADDSKLYLFDATGLGVRGDDDSSDTGGFFDAGFTVNGLADGLYYLAVTDYNYIPTSAGGDIFPSGSDVGPTGAGGGSPITGWSSNSHESSWTYTITLRGASYADAGGPVVPLPSAAGMGLVGLGLVGLKRRR